MSLRDLSHLPYDLSHPLPRQPKPSGNPAGTVRAFQCFAAGDHTDLHGRTVSFTASRLAKIAAGYNPAKLSAPLVIGRPESRGPSKSALRALVSAGYVSPSAFGGKGSNGPTFGTVRALVAEGPALFAIADVGFELLTRVRVGEFSNGVAAGFHLPDADENPTPGEYYLQHIGFLGLGDEPSNVTGMQPLAFADSGSRTFITGARESRNEQIHRVAQEMVRASPGMRYINAAIAVERALKR